MLNTLRYARALKNAGVAAQQAEAMADALEAEMVGELASKADITEVKAEIEKLATETKADVQRLENQIATLATETKSDNQRLDSKIDHLDEKLTGRIDSLDEKFNGRIDNLKTTIGVSIAIATLVLTAVQVYFGVR